MPPHRLQCGATAIGFGRTIVYEERDERSRAPGDLAQQNSSLARTSTIAPDCGSASLS